MWHIVWRTAQWLLPSTAHLAVRAAFAMASCSQYIAEIYNLHVLSAPRACAALPC